MSSKEVYDVHCICRMCLAENKVPNLKNMNNYSIKFNDENFPFTKLYFDYTGIAVLPNEEISPYVCDKCETVLVIAFNFRKAVKESNSFLNHIFQKIQAYEETVNGVIPNDERGRKVEELKRKIFSNNYCRFCYMESTSLNQLFGAEQKHKNYTLEKIFQTVAKFSLEANQLSSRVCKSCLNQMLQIHDSCLTAKTNDQYIKKSLDEAQRAISNGTLKIEKYVYPKEGAKSNGKGNRRGRRKKTSDDGVLEPEFIKLEPMEQGGEESDELEPENSEMVAFPVLDPMKDETEFLVEEENID